MKKCECCQIEHDSSFGSGRFCSRSCACRFSTKEKRSEINEKVSNSLKKEKRFVVLSCAQCSSDFEVEWSNRRQKYCSKSCVAKIKTEKKLLSKRGMYVRDPESIYDISPRTAAKILERLDIGCSRCAWKEAKCDIHHIRGKKIENANSHSNLTYICPNCHRLFHSRKIGPDDVKSLEQQIGDKWKQFYYG